MLKLCKQTDNKVLKSNLNALFFLSNFVPMPQYTNEGYRVTYLNLTDPNIENYEFFDTVKHCINIFEVILKNDVIIGNIMILDTFNVSIGHAQKITPMMLKKISVLMRVSRLYNFFSSIKNKFKALFTLPFFINTGDLTLPAVYSFLFLISSLTTLIHLTYFPIYIKYTKIIRKCKRTYTAIHF